MLKRKNFAKIHEVYDMPDLLETQLTSYSNFLQKNVRHEEKKDEGIQEVFLDIFPIESYDKQTRLEFISYL